MKTLPDKIAVLERHLAMLRRLLPRQQEDTLNWRYDIETMEEILADLRRQQKEPSLF